MTKFVAVWENRFLENVKLCSERIPGEIEKKKNIHTHTHTRKVNNSCGFKHYKTGVVGLLIMVTDVLTVWKIWDKP